MPTFHYDIIDYECANGIDFSLPCSEWPVRVVSNLDDRGHREAVYR